MRWLKKVLTLTVPALVIFGVMWSVSEIPVVTYNHHHKAILCRSSATEWVDLDITDPACAGVVDHTHQSEVEE